MGYTTDFEGQFHCYRVDSKDIGTFLKAVYEGDQASMGVLADWLTEHNDPLGQKIARLLARPTQHTATRFWRLFGLKPEHAAYLKQFNETRRMKRRVARAKLLPDPVREAAGLPLGKEGAYFVGGTGFAGQDHDDSVLNYNQPPKGQPGLWCQWCPNKDGTAIVWDQGEKFYDYVEWLKYLIEHFLAPWGYVLNGEMEWQGEEDEDRGKLIVKDNDVSQVWLGRKSSKK
ncbi:MAG: hypothetical protein L0Z62_01065 [Gemmataceae bacterium]|nr:hypothetical protein [Gemmataceae bacterium]